MYGDMDMTKVLYGDKAVHVPAWMVVQDAGEGLVSFAGGSRVPAPHPMRFGSDHVHQLFLGELVLRPHVVIASNQAVGYGLAGLVTDPFAVDDGSEPIVGKRREGV
jgi:hypothetical protein